MTESLLKMPWAQKAILQAHPSNRKRATAKFIIECMSAAQQLQRMLSLMDTPGYIADGPEAEQATEQIFQVINARFFEHFGESIPDGN
jgi:phosphotransferase system HPr-like phosphotransfer protein